MIIKKKMMILIILICSIKILENYLYLDYLNGLELINIFLNYYSLNNYYY